MCSSLIVYAHYFKEDAALAMGMCLVLLATRWMMMSRSRSGIIAGVILVGSACAIATSAKYIGIVFWIPGLIAILAPPARRWHHRLLRTLIFLLVFASLTVVINYRIFLNPAGFKKWIRIRGQSRRQFAFRSGAESSQRVLP